MEKLAKLECEIALLKQSGSLIKWLLPAVGTLAIAAAGFAWSSNATIAVLESENLRMKQQIQAVNNDIDWAKKEFGNTATWVEQNFVSQGIFNQHEKDHN